MPERVSYNPDVLSCLANLSNDEVFTPPEIANAMLDLLPQELFEDPNAKFLDPACKTGVFLREIAKRLLKGLEKKIPDQQERIDHIFHEQLYGIAITELTALMSRRSLYCSKDAAGFYSVSRFKTHGGNIRYNRIEHTWQKGNCIYCGASWGKFDRESELETHAYEFIHVEDIYKMKFDLIISNPPYQLNDGGGLGSSAKPIYQLFVLQALKLKPRYMTMIIPSRWFAGGKGLDDFRREMLENTPISKIFDFQDSRDCFPGVDIAGGVCFFLIDNKYDKDTCAITHYESGKADYSERRLNEFKVLIRDSISCSIVRRLYQNTKHFMNEMVSPRKPFGIESNEKKNPSGDLIYYCKDGFGKILSSKVTQGFDLISKHKLVVSKAASEHAGQKDANGQKKVLSRIEILPKNSVCSETYLVVFSSSDEKEVQNAKTYLESKFVRFLISCMAATQNISRESFAFVPVQDFSKSWTDEELYKKYGLTEKEIEFIESMIRPLE